MGDDLSSAIFIGDAERDPLRAAQKDQRRALPKRFYKEATFAAAEGGFAILLDGRPVRTPAGAQLALPSEPAAALVAAEWAAQGDAIDPATMPVTRLVNSALDGVARDIAGVAADIVKYLGSDLVCYRAGEPATLVAAQAALWDPVLEFARRAFGARFALAEGVMFVDQPVAATAAAGRVVEAHANACDGALRLAALHSMTTLTGSALIALAHVCGHFDVRQAWDAAHVDEDHQMRLWGMDAEALARRSVRFVDMKAASDLFAAL